MANTKRHTQLTAGKWHAYDRSAQILMIANELNRARNWLSKGRIEKTLPAYERALELCDMTLEDKKWRGHSRELLRFRECLAGFYAGKEESLQSLLAIYQGLLSLSVDSYNATREMNDDSGK